MDFGRRLLVIAWVGLSTSAGAQHEPFKDVNLPIAARVTDLLSRLSDDEKLNLLLTKSTAIDRVGIPAFDWTASVPFAGGAAPAPIGLAATFDPDLLQLLGKTTADGAIVAGPSISLMRDPRWGRASDTLGEDPFLAGHLAAALIEGVQGITPGRLRALVGFSDLGLYSGPRRPATDEKLSISPYDLEATYWNPIQYVVMSDRLFLLTPVSSSLPGIDLSPESLRKQTRFEGVVPAPPYVAATSKEKDSMIDPEEAYVVNAFKDGYDLVDPAEAKPLASAVKNGAITPSMLSASLKRVLSVRLQLGSAITSGHVEDSKELLRRAAQESIVLLQNKKNVLPFKAATGKIAVIGPNAKNPLIAGDSVSPLEAIQKSVSDPSQVLYSAGTGIQGRLDLQDIPESVTPDGFWAEFYPNEELSGTPVMTLDKQLNASFEEKPPADSVPASGFSVRWTGVVVPPAGGDYTIGITADDGVRMWINGDQVVDAWDNGPVRTHTVSVPLDADRICVIQVEYRHVSGPSTVKLSWSPPSDAPFREAVAAAKDADAVVLFLGLDSSVENGKLDRSTIELPDSQESLLRAIVEIGKPTVLVMINGGPVSSRWAKDHVDGILEAWYPGSEGGQAIADALFGKFNPSGKLPATTYSDTTQLPPIEDFDASKRSYRYSLYRPLFPFGSGLSYTHFSYSKLLAPVRWQPGGPLKLRVTVKNDGQREGDEVVQLYLSHGKPSAAMPRVALKAFQRVRLAPGEVREVEMSVSPRDLEVIREDGSRWIDPETVSIAVGGNQPLDGQPSTLTAQVVIDVPKSTPIIGEP
jgi:beta-glucosidase